VSTLGIIRRFMIVEAASFAVAARIHSGRLIAGYEHPRARIAETVIALVLLAGLAMTWIRPALLRPVGLVAQGFALVGTLVGLFTIAIGIGPRTVPDVIYHIVIVIVLVLGLRATKRLKPDG
jgi:hypothetical protein